MDRKGVWIVVSTVAPQTTDENCRVLAQGGQPRLRPNDLMAWSKPSAHRRGRSSHLTTGHETRPDSRRRERPLWVWGGTVTRTRATENGGASVSLTPHGVPVPLWMSSECLRRPTSLSKRDSRIADLERNGERQPAVEPARDGLVLWRREVTVMQTRFGEGAGQATWGRS